MVDYGCKQTAKDDLPGESRKPSLELLENVDASGQPGLHVGFHRRALHACVKASHVVSYDILWNAPSRRASSVFAAALPLAFIFSMYAISLSLHPASGVATEHLASMLSSTCFLSWSSERPPL